jgi:hypothetical protein
MKSLFVFLAQQATVPNAVNPAFFRPIVFFVRRLDFISLSLAAASWRIRYHRAQR